MENKKVLIVGSGHLAARLRQLIEKEGVSCMHIQNNEDIPSYEGGTHFDNISGRLSELDMSSFRMVYLLDHDDEQNLKLIIALMRLNVTLPVTASLFNENIAPHLLAAYPNLQILNPARMAAPAFAEALNKPLKHRMRYESAKLPVTVKRKGADTLIWKLIIGFATLIILATTFFHVNEKLSWLDAIYFVIVTVASVGYGDISILHSSALSKVVNIALIISSMVFIWMIFSLVIDRIIKKRIQLSLGQRRYSYHNHVIVCGLGRLGYCVVEELLKMGEKVIIVEMDEDSDKASQLRMRGVDVYTGNASSFAVLADVNVLKARAVISAIDNDYLNLEIGLNARSFNSNLRVILRMFDEQMAQQVKDDLDIHLILSMSALADEKFLALLKIQVDINQAGLISSSAATTT